MKKGDEPSLFVNDGSFMERFKQLQQEKDNESRSGRVISGISTPTTVICKTNIDIKSNDKRTPALATSSGKLVFSLKQKSKLVTPAVKLGEDDDETDDKTVLADGPTKRQKLGKPDAFEKSSRHADVALSSPSDPAVKTVADKLASFVAKNGRQIEHVTRQKNPGDTPFKFLFDEGCADYKYYEYQLAEEEKALFQSGNSQTSHSVDTSLTPRSTASSQKPGQNHSNYQIPASALYETVEDLKTSATSMHIASSGGEFSTPGGSDPIAMMEFYMKKAAHEERRRQPKLSKDEMPPPASLQGPMKKGHHMGDYIPPEELDKFLATCNDAAAQKAAKEAADKARIQADNVGHKLLSKMGWREGEGLGSSNKGIADPIMAGGAKHNNLGVGAHNPGEVTEDDDIYDQYKKRMMLGYRHRPNPMGNPRKSYY